MSTKKQKRQPWPKIRQVTNNGKLVWQVDGRINGAGARYFFDFKTEAETKADQLRAARKNEGIVGVSIPERLRIEALEAEKRLSAVGATITDAVDYYLKHAKPEGGKKTVSEVVVIFLKEKKDEGVRPEYLRIMDSVLGYFTETFGTRPVHEIQHTEIKEWFLSQPWSLRTRRNRQRDLLNVFNLAVREGYCVVNPITRLGVPKFEEPPPGILTVEQASALLNTAAQGEGELLPYTAIGLFAGLRTAELAQLDWAEVDLEHRTIEVKAKKAKTRARRIIDVSDNLAAWLKPHLKRSGPITPTNGVESFKRLRKKAGIDPWPHNALRHSFASYHLASCQNANTTALQLGHHNTNQLFASYRELVKPKEAKLYWALVPSEEASKKVVQIQAA